MTCLRCEDSGWTPVATRTVERREFRNSQGKKVACVAQAAVSKPAGSYEAEEWGPCDCASGKLVEFPPPDERGKARVGPWGQDGYWRGRPHNLPPGESKLFLSKAENAKRSRELLARLGGVAKAL